MKVFDLDVHKKVGSFDGWPDTVRRFYAPEDDVHGVLVDVLKSATRSVVVAMYGYDDDELAQILDDALKNPAIYVQITLDKSQAGGVHERALLEKYAHEMTGNSVAIGTSEKSAIMHRKMAVVDGVWSIGGSTNWSAAGETKQDNELSVFTDPRIAVDARTVMDLEHTKALKQMAATKGTP